MPPRQRRVYDHRIKEAIVRSRNPGLFPELRIPPVGVRVDRPNAAWHVDCTILKLLDGSKAYVHAVVDNFSRTTVRTLVGWYVHQHNAVLPHAAFQGQTPDELYFGAGADVPDRLARQRHEARQTRLDRNRQAACSRCPRNAQKDLAA